MTYPYWHDNTSGLHHHQSNAHAQSMLMAGIASEASLQAIERALPPVFTRQIASKILGGLISSKTLSNLDALGQGVPNKIRIGSKVGYERASFMQWLRGRLAQYR